MPDSKLKFFVVEFFEFQNTTRRVLYVNHNHNCHRKSNGVIVPALMFVEKDEHESLLNDLPRGTPIRIKSVYNAGAVTHTLVDVQVAT